MPTECRAFPNFKFFYRVAKKCGEVKEEKMEDIFYQTYLYWKVICFI